MKRSVGIRPIVTGLVVLAALCSCALAACPSADLNGDCLVDFNDFSLLAADWPETNYNDLTLMAAHWLKFNDQPPTILNHIDMQTDDPNEPNLFSVELVVIGKQRVDRTVFQYECQVILTNLSAAAIDNAHLVMTAWPENMTIIDPHVTFGETEIAPGESAAALDTCTFTVDRSIPIDPLEIVWRYITAPQDMTFISGGTFQMGDSLRDGYNDELPVHTVMLDSFFMCKYEVTNGQYCDYLNSAFSQGLITVASDMVYQANSVYRYCEISPRNSYSQIAYSGAVFTVRTKNGRDMSNDPMVEVSWYGAAAYCNWRSEQEGNEQCYNLSTWDCDFSNRGYRLATEGEWEYAARGGLSGRRFPWGDTISHSQANYFSNSSFPYDISPTRGPHPAWDDGVYPYTSPVDSFAANLYGLYDMAGNVSEWCNDWYSDSYYSSSPTNNPRGPITGSFRIIRGGIWISGADNCRVAYRYTRRPTTCGYYIGFRCVVDLE